MIDVENIDLYEIEINKELYYLFHELSKFSAEEWIYFEFPFNNKSFMIEPLLDEIDKIIYENTDLKSNSYEEFQLVIYKTIRPFFKFSIKYKEIGSFLIFHHVNFHFLKLDISKLLKIHNLNEQFKDFLQILAKFFKDLNSPTLNLKNNNINGFYNKMIENINVNEMKYSTSLLKLINMDETNYFTINSKLVFSNEIFSLILFFKNYDFNLFVETMIESTTFFSSILFIKSCSIKELLIIFQNDIEYNEFITFSSLKKILDEEYEQMAKNKKLIKNILSKVFEQDKDFFKKIIKIFDKNMLFNDSIGLLNKENAEIDIEFIFSQFEISYFSQENNYRRKILENYDRTENQYFKLLKISFSKRKEYLNNLLDDDSKCLFLNYALTDFCDFILYYYLDYIDNNNILNEINKTLISIKYLNSEWFKSIKDYRNKFYVYYSDLLILSCAYHYENLHNDETSALVKELILDGTFEKMLYENDYPSLSTIKKVYYD